MASIDTVLDIAERCLDEHIRPRTEATLVVARVLEFPDDWVVSYADRRFIETPEYRYLPPGRAPFVIPKAGDDIWQAGSGSPIDIQLNKRGRRTSPSVIRFDVWPTEEPTWD